MARVVVLDIDDTLFLERDYVRSGFAAVDAEVAKEHGLKGFSECAWRLFCAGVRGRIFDEALKVLGVELQSAALADLVAVYRSHLPRIELTCDSLRFLNAVRRQGLPLAVVSDGFYVAQKAKVSALGLETFISPIVLTDAFGRDGWKPSDRGYLEVFGRFGGSHKDYIYIGDNPNKDFVAPNALGWRTIRIRRPLGEHALTSASGEDQAAQHEIASFDELLVEPLRDLL
ncbi:MAG: HAD family hydrolase [Alphaproteobacteria bacterium]|nr:HAD family hydrolase [Alphaproteobacteria bacterium]